jgi:hypothetical protein
MPKLICRDLSSYSIDGCPNDLMCEHFIIFTPQVITSTLQLSFKTCKRIFDRVIIRGIWGEEFESATLPFNYLAKILALVVHQLTMFCTSDLCIEALSITIIDLGCG